MERYFLNSGKKTRGPFRLEEIQSMLRRGKLRPEDPVWSAEEDRWVEAAQLERVRSMFPKAGETLPGSTGRQVLALASGKGGVGKTVLSASIASALAVLGHRVLLVDGDWGGPDLHLQFGILDLPKRDGESAHSHRGVQSLIVDTPVPNLRLLCAEPGVLGAAEATATQRMRFLRTIHSAEVDYVVLDLGAGTNYLVLDLFVSADVPIVVATPDPMSIQEAFNIVKMGLLWRVIQKYGRDSEECEHLFGRNPRARRLVVRSPIPQLLERLEQQNSKLAARIRDVVQSWRPRLILNMVRNGKERMEAGALEIACRELLGVELGYLGHVDWDPKVKESVKKYRPFLLDEPRCPASRGLAKLVAVQLLGKGRLEGFFAGRKVRKAAALVSEDIPTNGSQAEIICSYRCSYWGDCEFQRGGEPCPVRQLEPVFRASLVANSSS